MPTSARTQAQQITASVSTQINGQHVFDRPVIGMDIAKNVFQIHATRGQKIERRQLKRSAVLRYFTKCEPSIVAMEACGGSHYWARQLEQRGHTVRLLPAQHVAQLVVGDKTDANDAQAIHLAAHLPQIKSVAIKTEDQLAMQTLHRHRAQLVKMRIMQTNAIRGVLLEYGEALPKGAEMLQTRLPALMAKLQAASPCPVPKFVLEIITDLQQRAQALQEDIKRATDRLTMLSRTVDDAAALIKIPGIGPVTATAMLTVDVKRFQNARHFTAWLGLNPAQSGTGGKVVQAGLSKRGDTYLRWLLMQCARAVITSPSSKHSSWLKGLLERRPHNVVAGAVAAKIGRTIWGVLAKGSPFDRTLWLGLADQRMSSLAAGAQGRA